MAILKHVGKYGEKPCVIVFREVPNEPESCLVVISEGLEEIEGKRLSEEVKEKQALMEFESNPSTLAIYEEELYNTNQSIESLKNARPQK